MSTGILPALLEVRAILAEFNIVSPRVERGIAKENRMAITVIHGEGTKDVEDMPAFVQRVEDTRKQFGFRYAEVIVEAVTMQTWFYALDANNYRVMLTVDWDNHGSMVLTASWDYDDVTLYVGDYPAMVKDAESLERWVHGRLAEWTLE